MRVIECNECGETVSAATDDELRERLAGHMQSEHPDVELEQDQLDELVDENAYSATDS